MAIARAQYSIKDLNDIVAQASPPVNPVPGLLWRNTSVTPNELLAWTGKGTQTDRRYPVGKLDSYQVIDDLSDQHAIKITIRNETYQYGSGTPSPDNVRPLGATGNGPLSILVLGENISNPSIAGTTKNGVTLTYDAATQTITFNGTCTANNTNFFFDEPPGYPTMLKFPHILSAHYVSGSRTLAGENSIWVAENNYRNAVGVMTLPDSGMAASAAVPVPRAYKYFAIRIDAGTVLNNYKFHVKVEFGTTATDWVRYVGTRYQVTLHPGTQLFGLPGVQDWRNTDGMEAHYTGYYELDGNTTLYGGTVYSNCVSFDIILPTSATPGDANAICSHFERGYHNNDVQHFYVSNSGARFFVPKSKLTSYDLAGVKAWLAAQKNAGTPVQVVYQLATPEFYGYDSQQITGVDGRNVIFGEGAYIGVEYTGSGWAAVGAVQRIAIENVEITPELGIKVSQVLTDGTSTKNVYTRLYHGGLQIFDVDTGKLIGGLFLQNGEVYMFASALADPRRVTDLVIAIESSSGLEGMVFRKGAVSAGGIYALFNADGTPREMSLQTEGAGDTPGNVPWSIWSGLSNMRISPYKIEFNVDGNGLGLVSLTLDGESSTATIDGHWMPEADSVSNLGDSIHRWKKIYAASSTISTSDEREKHDIAPLDADQLTRFLMALAPVSYRLNAIPTDLHYGFVAQAFKAAMDATGIPGDYAGYDGSNPDHLGLSYGELDAVQTAVIQQQQRRLDDLEARLRALEHPEATPEASVTEE